MSELYDRWHSIRLVLAICGVLVIAVIGREIIADVNRNGVVLAMTAAKKLVAMAVILIGYWWGVKEWIAGGRKGNLRWGGWQRGGVLVIPGTVCMVAAIAFSIADVRRLEAVVSFWAFVFLVCGMGEVVWGLCFGGDGKNQYNCRRVEELEKYCPKMPKATST